MGRIGISRPAVLDFISPFTPLSLRFKSFVRGWESLG